MRLRLLASTLLLLCLLTGRAQTASDKLLSGSEDDNLLLSNFLNDDTDAGADMINLNKIDGRVKASSVKRINDIVEKNPDAAVNIVRGWLYQNENNG